MYRWRWMHLTRSIKSVNGDKWWNKNNTLKLEHYSIHTNGHAHCAMYSFSSELSACKSFTQLYFTIFNSLWRHTFSAQLLSTYTIYALFSVAALFGLSIHLYRLTVLELPTRLSDYKKMTAIWFIASDTVVKFRILPHTAYTLSIVCSPFFRFYCWVYVRFSVSFVYFFPVCLWHWFSWHVEHLAANTNEMEWKTRMPFTVYIQSNSFFFISSCLLNVWFLFCICIL